MGSSSSPFGPFAAPLVVGGTRPTPSASGDLYQKLIRPDRSSWTAQDR